MSAVKEFTVENFDRDVLSSTLPVMVDFWASWCGPCKMLAPHIEKLAEEYSGRCIVGKVNVDTQGQLAQRFGISSIPSIHIFKNGSAVDKIIGAMPLPKLKEFVDRNL